MEYFHIPKEYKAAYIGLFTKTGLKLRAFLRRADFEEKEFPPGITFDEIREWAQGQRVFVVNIGCFIGSDTISQQPEFLFEDGILFSEYI